MKKKLISANYLVMFLKRNASVICLIAIGILCSISIIENYRFVKDDTGNIVPFYFHLLEMKPLRLLDYYASNEWLGYQPRSFFLTWWIQIILIKLFGMQDLFNNLRIPFAVFAGVIHTINAFLIFQIASKFNYRKLGFLIGSLYIVLPTAPIAYLISNNWFFLLPLFFLLCFTNALFSKMKAGLIKNAILIILLCCTIFSGEQLMAVPFIICSLQLAYTYKQNKIDWVVRKSIYKQDAFIIFFGILIYIWYAKFYVVSPVPMAADSVWSKNIFDLPKLLSIQSIYLVINYTKGMFEFIFRFFQPFSNLYGSGDISFSISTIALSILSSIMFSMGLIDFKITAQSPVTLEKVSRITLTLLCIFIAGMLPMYFGALSGSRPGADDRYLLAPTLIFICATIFLLELIFNKLQLLKNIMITMFFFYCSMLTFHLNIDVWEAQKRLDARQWQAIYKALESNPDFILTINNDLWPTHRGLQRPYLSAAWTDFNGDWGVNARLRYQGDKKVTLIQNIELHNDNSLVAIDYWGGKKQAHENKIKVIYFNDGQKMRDAINGEITVMSLQEYLQEKQLRNIPDRVVISKK